MDMKNVTKIPLTKAKTPFNGARVYAGYWWVVQDGCILLWCGRSPQANPNKEIAERLGAKLYPGSTVEFLDAAFVPDRE